MADSTRIHLAADLSVIHANSTWNYPGSWSNYPAFGAPDLYQDVARLLERGMFDLAFFADTGGTQGDGDSFDETIRWGSGWPRHDPIPMAVMMAAVTSRLGIGVTMSTTYLHPFHVARQLSSLDHVTKGRIAWNVVTGAYRNEAANWGHDEMPDHEWRYERAEEHVSVCEALWNSVAPDALLLDPVSGEYAEPSKVHRIDHRGEHFRVAGPLPVIPSPQGRPPIISAGASPSGLALSARHADYQFASAGTLDGMIDHRTKLDAALAVAGRKPRDVGVLWNVRVDVVSGADEARERERAFFAAQPPGAALHHLTRLFSVDMSRFDPDETMGVVVETVKAENTNWGYLNDAVRSVGPDARLKDFAENFLLRGSVEAVGTPAQVADRLEEMHGATGENGGFILSRFFSVPGQIARIVDELVPELQRRGLVPTEYAGPLLRDNLLC